MIFLSWMSGKLCVYMELWKEMYKGFGRGFLLNWNEREGGEFGGFDFVCSVV